MKGSHQRCRASPCPNYHAELFRLLDRDLSGNIDRIELGSVALGVGVEIEREALMEQCVIAISDATTGGAKITGETFHAFLKHIGLQDQWIGQSDGVAQAVARLKEYFIKCSVDKTEL